MKLGNLLGVRQDKEKDLPTNPRSLIGKMGLSPTVGTVPPYGGSTSAPFIPDWIPTFSPTILAGSVILSCPSSALYRYTRASLVTGTNVTSYLSIITSSAGGISSAIGYINLYVKVWPGSATSPISNSVNVNTPPNTYLGGGFVLASYTSAANVPPSWTIPINPGQWVSFCIEIIQPWLPGSSNAKTVNIRFGPSQDNIPINSSPTSFLNFEYPSGCSWAPFAPSPTPNWSDPSGTYS